MTIQSQIFKPHAPTSRHLSTILHRLQTSLHRCSPPPTRPRHGRLASGAAVCARPEAKFDRRETPRAKLFARGVLFTAAPRRTPSARTKYGRLSAAGAIQWATKPQTADYGMQVCCSHAGDDAIMFRTSNARSVTPSLRAGVFLPSSDERSPRSGGKAGAGKSPGVGGSGGRGLPGLHSINAPSASRFPKNQPFIKNDSLAARGFFKSPGKFLPK